MFDILITFETAKLAKEKGFFGKFFKEDYYTISGKLYRDMKAMSFNSDIHIFAPTQSLLQKWLREKHNIDIRIDPPIDINGTYDAGIFEKKYSVTCNSGIFSSYEEALEQGLWKALKLI